MTRTEDDLRAALRLLEQRTPTIPELTDGDPIRQPFAFVSNNIVPARRSRAGWAVAVLAAAVVIAVVAGTIAIITNSQLGTRQLQPAKSPTAAGVDFSQDAAANSKASEFGQKLLAALPPLAGYAGLQIVRYGIEVDVVGPPSDAIRAAVARNATQYQGKPIPVRYRSVRHTERELQSELTRVEADTSYWNQQGIEPTSWVIDLNSNTVQVWLAHYTDAYRDALLARYGSDWVSVVPER